MAVGYSRDCPEEDEVNARKFSMDRDAVPGVDSERSIQEFS
jgi:hypothetical protein